MVSNFARFGKAAIEDRGTERAELGIENEENPLDVLADEGRRER